MNEKIDEILMWYVSGPRPFVLVVFIMAIIGACIGGAIGYFVF